MDLPATIFPAIATVIAAFIAAFVAFVSSVLSKDQKTSEFRYTWLNSVLDDIAKFTGAAESISGTAWALYKNGGAERAHAFLVEAEPQIREMLGAYYRARIRLYPEEHKEVHKSLEALQALFLKGEIPDPGKVDPLVRELVTVSHEALKAQWEKIKRGETTFRWTKYISLAVIVIAVVIGIVFAGYRALGPQSTVAPSPAQTETKKDAPSITAPSSPQAPAPRPSEKQDAPVLKDPASTSPLPSSPQKKETPLAKDPQPSRQ